MPSISKYISVLAPPTETGTVTLKMVSANRTPAVSFSIDIEVTDVELTARQFATLILAALNQAFEDNDALYSGAPQFSGDGEAPFTFRVIQCDHLINIWSQAQFFLEVETNDIGFRFAIEEIPIFSTIKEAKKLGQVLGVSFLNSEGTPYDDEDMELLLRSASQEIIGYANGNVMAASTYLVEDRGFITNGIMLDYFPILFSDRPVIRGPWMDPALNNSPVNQLVGGFQLDTVNGILSFDSTFYPNESALWIDNMVAMTYAAGLSSIHPLLKQETVRVCSYINQPVQVAKMKGGTFSIDFTKREEVISMIQANVNRILGR